MNKCKCDEIEIQISEMILGEVSKETSEKVHEHIAECESCMGFYLSMAETFDDENDAVKVDGLTQTQKMKIFTEAKAIDTIKNFPAKPPVKKFPWMIVLTSAAAVCISGVIILPTLSSARSSVKNTYEESQEHSKLFQKKESKAVVSVDEEILSEAELAIEEPLPSQELRMRSKKQQNFLRLESDIDKIIEIKDSVGSDSPVLTTVVMENVETDDAALEDFSDEAPSTDDNSLREIVSDVVVSTSAFASPNVYGGRSAAGRASEVDGYKGPVPVKKEDSKDSIDYVYNELAQKGLNLLVDSDEELQKTEEKRDDLLAKKSKRLVADNPIRHQMQNTIEQPQSTFSIDVDTAGYQIAKSQIVNNLQPDASVLRAEEFINYQNYNYQAPKRETFNIEADMTVSPFHKGSNILRVGIQGRRPGGDVKALQNNFMFIVDTSGSMADDGRLPLAKKVIPMIVNNMQPGDKVSLIAGGLTPRMVLENVDASEKDRINREVESLNAVGATNLEANLIEGYQQVAMNVAPNTYNRVVLMSDGVANLGEVSANNILKNLEESKEKGIGLTVVGMGSGEYNDNFLEQLANNGDGNYVYIEDGVEAQKTFEENFAQTFHTIANNVKIQVDFDPQQVTRYRLLGYENRRLKNEDFRNDKVDAGEVGSGQSVTAIYEVELAQQQTAQPMAVINMRYKDVRDNQMKEQQLKFKNRLVSNEFNQAPASLRLAFLAGKYAEVLKSGGSDEGVTIKDLLKYMRPLAAELNNDPNVQEMLQLMNKSK